MHKLNKIIILIVSLCIISIFLILALTYVVKIKIYEDLDIVMDSSENPDINIEIIGRTVFNKEILLIDSLSVHQNRNNYFKELSVRAKKNQDFIIKNQKIKINRKIYTIDLDNPDELGDEYKYYNINYHTNSSFFSKVFYISKCNLIHLLNIFKASVIFKYFKVLLVLIVITLILLLKRFKSNSQTLVLISKVVTNNRIRLFRYSCYIIILFLGVFFRFSNPISPLLALDYIGHLRPVAMFFLHGEFDHFEMSYPYPVFLISILSIFKNINSIVIIQHLLSTITIAGFLVFIEAKYKNVALCCKFNNIIFTILTVFFFYMIFFNDYLIFLEKNIHHEGIIIPSTLIYIVLLFLYYNEKVNRKRTYLFLMVLSISFIFSLLHYRMIAGFIAISLIVLIYEIRIRLKTNKRNVYIPILVYTVLALIVFLPEKYLIQKYEKTAPAFKYTQFFYSNARTIKKALQDGHAVIPEHDTTTLIKNIRIVVGENNYEIDTIINDIHYKNSNYPFLGYNSDFLNYELELPALCEFLTKHYFDITKNELFVLFEEKEEYSSFYNNYFKEWTSIIIFNYPFDVIKKSINQIMNVFFNLNKPLIIYNSEISHLNSLRFPSYIDFSLEFDSITALYDYTLLSQSQQAMIERKILKANLLHEFMIDKYNFKPNQHIKYKYPKFMESFMYMNDTVIRILLLLNIAYIIILVIKRRVSLFIVSIFTFIILSLLTVAVLHTFDVNRYFYALLPIIICFNLFSFLYLLKNNCRQKS